MVKHLVIRVAGRVQGVWFRQSAYDEAKSLGLAGTVQNLSDGSVEIRAEGEETNLQQLLEWCKDGPEHAKVDSVESSEQKAQGYKDFKII